MEDTRIPRTCRGDHVALHFPGRNRPRRLEDHGEGGLLDLPVQGRHARRRLVESDEEFFWRRRFRFAAAEQGLFARTVPRADLRLQGRRPAVLGAPLRVYFAGEEGAVDDPRCDVGRHGKFGHPRRARSGERRVLHLVPGEPDLKDPGSPDGHRRRPERPRRRSEGGGVRRLPENRQGALRRRVVPSRRQVGRRQLHQLGPHPRADHLLLLRDLQAPRGGKKRGKHLVFGADGKLRRRPRGLLRQGDGAPIVRGPHRRDERQRHPLQVLPVGRLRAARGRGDPDVGAEHGHLRLQQLRALLVPLRRKRPLEVRGSDGRLRTDRPLPGRRPHLRRREISHGLGLRRRGRVARHHSPVARHNRLRPRPPHRRRRLRRPPPQARRQRHPRLPRLRPPRQVPRRRRKGHRKKCNRRPHAGDRPHRPPPPSPTQRRRHQRPRRRQGLHPHHPRRTPRRPRRGKTIERTNDGD
mmetsp:Transcript_7827/g.25711  ORF Transcript_7827/g.25711 Transcript_7827/m.25711 type:complete len:467 (+) Transcript_7827:191-1591(+)